MSRNTGMPSASMKLSYGVFGRPNLPKPARLPPVGSCQCTWSGTSCMSLLLFFDFRRRHIRLLGRVGLVHLRAQPALGELLREQLAGFRVLVGVIDLVATGAPADPGLRHALRVADGDALVLEGEIARRRRA